MGRMTKANRLALAGVVAPVLRSQDARTARRRVKVYDRATGEVVREISLVEAQKGLLATAKIELEVQPDERPTHVSCELCGRVLPVEKGRVPPKACRSGCDRQQTCAGWGPTEGLCDAIPPGEAFTLTRVRRRSGQPWLCDPCSKKKRSADPVWRAANADRLRGLSASPKWRATIAAKNRARARDPEQRAKIAEGVRERSRSAEWRQRVEAAGIARRKTRCQRGHLLRETRTHQGQCGECVRLRARERRRRLTPEQLEERRAAERQRARSRRARKA